MNRFHLHVNVEDLDKSISFYTTLFGLEPEVVKPDYAKWHLENPAVNFAISTGYRPVGVAHVGFQVDDSDELKDIHRRLLKTGGEVLVENDVHCCYATSDKSWVKDPNGLHWESFMSSGESDVLYSNLSRTFADEETIDGSHKAEAAE